MSERNGRTSAAELRAAFDLSFALAPDGAREPGEKLLRIRIGDAPFSFRLSEVEGVHVVRRIVPCPSERSELLGIAGVRGRPVPVFSLSALLGVRGVEGKRPGWILLAKRESDSALAFAFDALDGYLEARPEDLAAAASGAHVRTAVRIDGAACVILDMNSLIAACERRTGSREI